MKDNLFEMLMNLFETSLAQLQQSQKALANNASTELAGLNSDEQSVEMKFIKTAQNTSTRIFTYEEQIKLSKASYQFLKRMRLWGILDAAMFELVLNQLDFSDSYIVTLEETKWTIRTVMSNFLSEDQMTFLDLVLYQKEDELIAH
jgi:uncharacterized protein Smg (DUF494 family)